MKTAIYPGSFDPITNGHLDIIKRACCLFDKVIVCVAENPNKKYYFSASERALMVKEATKNLNSIEVITSKDLIVNEAKKHQACAIIRGLRAVSDFEFEFQLAAGNEFLDPEVEMVFLMTSPGMGFISSSNIKEFYSHGADISRLVPQIVIDIFKSKKA